MARTDTTRFLIRGHRDGSYNIALTGPLDGHAASSLRCVLLDFERDRVTLDLTECTGVADDALDALAAASRVAEVHGGRLQVHSTRWQRPADNARGKQLEDPPKTRSLIAARPSSLTPPMQRAADRLRCVIG